MVPWRRCKHAADKHNSLSGRCVLLADCCRPGPDQIRGSPNAGHARNHMSDTAEPETALAPIWARYSSWKGFLIRSRPISAGPVRERDLASSSAPAAPSTRRRHTPTGAPPLQTHFLSRLWVLTKAANASTEDTTKRDIAMKRKRLALGGLHPLVRGPNRITSGEFVLRVKRASPPRPGVKEWLKAQQLSPKAQRVLQTARPMGESHTRSGARTPAVRLTCAIAIIALVVIQLQACTPVHPGQEGAGTSVEEQWRALPCMPSTCGRLRLRSPSRKPLLLTSLCSTRREALSSNRKFYSLEFFPPHTIEGARNLVNRMDRLVKLEPKPLSIDVTWTLDAGKRCACARILRVLWRVVSPTC